MSETKKRSKSYYLTPVKFIRDLVHKYVNLTEFELKIIDTPHFQRLKDIRQLTCQHVFRAANHTRFEHSLGVLELTRRAIRHLRENGIIASKGTSNIIDEKLEFNACLAALLHDVGHCPFSHLGEIEFNAKEVTAKLLSLLFNKDEASASDDSRKKPDNNKIKVSGDLYEKIKKEENIGSVHEQMSCIVIIERYSKKHDREGKNDEYETDFCIDIETDFEIKTDFELIIRSILGVEYDISTAEKFKKNKTKNMIVRLINSNIFDMDKLDYIMRDSFFTGIGTPAIDTKRLFRNMFLNNKMEIVFKDKAISALQHMIDSRDELYMYVYNHHAVVYSDFVNTYISRKLVHSKKYLKDNILPKITDSSVGEQLESVEINKLASTFKRDIFSVDAIVKRICSDSDWISFLNKIYVDFGNKESCKNYGMDILLDNVETLVKKLDNTVNLITQYKRRGFLKPWWKTIFEFNSFIQHHFRDDSIRRDVCKFICTGGKDKDGKGLDAEEFRSQIAKHVIYIIKKLNKMNIENFDDGDFFVIQRATRFFEPDTIEKLEIYFKNSGIIGAPSAVNDKTEKYYAKKLTRVIPQKDYESMYAKEGFYVFSKQISKKDELKNYEQRRKRQYELIEQIFVFVSTELVKMGEQNFVECFQKKENEDTQPFKKRLTNNEESSKKQIFNLFKDNHPDLSYDES